MQFLVLWQYAATSKAAANAQTPLPSSVSIAQLMLSSVLCYEIREHAPDSSKVCSPCQFALEQELPHGVFCCWLLPQQSS